MNKLFQEEVQKWLVDTFGEKKASDKVSRMDRFLEEVFELLQSLNYPIERIDELKHYVYDRPKGKPHQELGGVALTLVGVANAHRLKIEDAAFDELNRVLTKQNEIRKKEESKPEGSARPGNYTPTTRPSDPNDTRDRPKPSMD